MANRTLDDVRTWPRDRLLALNPDAYRTRVLDEAGNPYDLVVQGYTEGQQPGEIRIIVSVNDVEGLWSAMNPKMATDAVRIPD